MFQKLYLEFICNFDSIKPILFFMLMDYITALLAAIYQKSLNSTIGYKGIIKKIGIFVCIAIVSQMDKLNLMQESIKITPLVLLFFIFNEIISCFENLNKLKIPIPTIIQDTLKKIKEKNK